MKILGALFIILLILLFGYSSQLEYEAVKKYYPGMTYIEYLSLQDKLKIISGPGRNDE